MSRRICLALLAASFALAAPAISLAQSSSQAQYQGVAPETQVPAAGGTGSSGTGGGANGVTGAGTTGSGGSSATGGGRPASGTSGASGNGGGTGTGTAAGGAQPASIAAPASASSSSSPFSSGDFVLIVLACVGLVGLGLVLRRATRGEPAGV